MGWFSKLIGDAPKDPIKAVFDGIGAIVTSDEERAAAELIKLKALQEPDKLQVELNKIEAQHRTIFIAGWRPCIGWICAIGLAFPFLINPIIQWIEGVPGPELPLDVLLELVLAMLGLAGLRTFEKIQGKTR